MSSKPTKQTTTKSIRDSASTTVPMTVESKIPSGFDASCRSQMVLGFALLTVTYFVVVATFDEYIQPWLNLPPSSDELCAGYTPSTATTAAAAASTAASNTSTIAAADDERQQQCWRSDLLAFEITSGVALVWSAWIGFKSWHITGSVHTCVGTTRDGRLFGYLPEAHALTAIGTTFQIFDLFVSLLIPEQRDWIFLCHHIMAATVSWFGLNNQYFHYYGVFFLGCSEISTAPLIFIDMAKFFPPREGTLYDTAVSSCGPLFALTFTYYRVILWWKVSYMMFKDIFGVLNDGTASKMRPGRNHVLYVMMGLNLLLGFLQLYWFSIILEEAMKVLGISSEPDDAGTNEL